MTSVQGMSYVELFARTSSPFRSTPTEVSDQSGNTTPRAYVAPNATHVEQDYLPVTPEASFDFCQKSPSGHSVASSTTSDSGFQSVTTLNLNQSAFSKSPNSAFSPHMKESRSHPTVSQTDDAYRIASAMVNSGRVEEDAPGHDAVFEPPSAQEPVAEISYAKKGNWQHDRDDYEQIASYATMPRSLRRMKYAARYNRQMHQAQELNKSNEDLDRTGDSAYYSDKSLDGSYERGRRPSTKSRADAMLKNFIDKAEERDKRARTEQRVISKRTKPRARSASANRAATFSDPSKGRHAPGLRRSNSNVDMQKIIQDAEARDKHAHLDQARLEGVIPPRRYLPPKDPVRVTKYTTASSIIQKYEDRRKSVEESSYYAPKSPSDTCSVSSRVTYGGFEHSKTLTPRSVVDEYQPYRTSQTASYKKSPSSIHSDQGFGYSVARYTPRYREYRSRQDSDDDVKTPPPHQNNAPRPAMSMGNLQHSSAAEPSKTKALDEWQKTWEAKRAMNTYQRNRAKSSSSNALSSNPPPARAAPIDNYNRRKQVESLITGHAPKSTSPRQDYTSPTSTHFPTPPPMSTPTPPASDVSKSYGHGTPRSAMDNPNYDQLPPPPTPPPESPLVESSQSQQDTPRDYSKPILQEMKKGSPLRSSPYERGSSDAQGSQTMGRPAGSKKTPEVARVTPTQKASSKSSTLPRHFKSAQAWDVDSRQRAVQEQLNALRDEEIEELTSRIDNLSTIEKSRLNNLLQEREFQRRVEEENKRMFSDEDGSDEDYDVPDRPDRDRLLRLQDNNAEKVDPQREQEERDRREEERERKKQMERERREQEEQERLLRERLEREKREHEEKEWRRKEQERRQKEIEERRQREWEEEERRRFQRERDERERREWEEHKERQRKAHEQEEIHRKSQETIRMNREMREKSNREMEAEKEARRRAHRIETEQRRRRERRMKSSEEDAKEEAEREFLERKLSMGKPSNFPKYSATSYMPSSYGVSSRFNRFTPATSSTTYSAVNNSDSGKAVRRDNSSRAPRPVSDGYMLGKTDHWLPEDKLPSPSPVSSSIYNVSTSPTSESPTRPTTYKSTYSTPRVIGTQERYKDPRDKREADIKREQSLKRRQQEPSYMTFKDRQRLFSTGNTPVQKPKASKKLLEIQNNLRGEL